MRVVFPAPFSPSRTWMSPGAHGEVDRIVGHGVAERLGDSPHLDGRRAAQVVRLMRI